ncbi:MAG TPA: tetratricopeptide repeat protein [Gemmatimonadota bacterium]
MAEPKRKAREKRAVGADPLAGLDSERLASLLVERGEGRRAGPAPAEESPRRKRIGRRAAAAPRPPEELQLELEAPPVGPRVERPRATPFEGPRAKARAPETPPAELTPPIVPGPVAVVPPPEDVLETPAVDAGDAASALAAARALAAQGRSTQAVALLERALEGPAPPAEVAVELGRAYVRAGAFNEAEEALERAGRMDPESGEARLEMGVLLSKKGLYAQAVEALREGIVMECDAARGHYYLGICLNQLDRIDEAEAAFEQAVAADPGSDRAWYQLGIVWDRKGDVDRAREMYRRARQVAAKARG